jgi:putative CocE/NonD family hydrolase
MRIKTDFPRQIREIESTWITLADGTRLAARIWLPVDAEQNPVPALLEYIPYRKNDGTAVRDAIRHPYLAGHGYAAIRVDMRGSGDSDGIMYDEYLPQEQDDALEVLDWIAAQPWCTGNIGMFGKSWGGFNGLQIAARKPPSLKAIITIASTDDRYADDVHYMGGCLLASEMLPWASIMFAYNALPPDPHFVGDKWREMWHHRLNQAPPYVEAWMAHQHRDAFWQHGSVCEKFSDIECAVYAVGGWADGYTNAIPRLLEGLTCPKKGLIGPWAHNFPEKGGPEPTIGFLQESLRWWDYWLKGIDTGIMAEPSLRVWLQESHTPAAYQPAIPGRWAVEEGWPSSRIMLESFELMEDRVLAGEQESVAPLTGAGENHPLTPSPFHPLLFTGQQTTGLDGVDWCPVGVPGDFALDQQGEDGRCLTFTSPPQPTTDILGFPDVVLDMAVDQPHALLCVRLCDVAPTGESLLVTWGLLNLTHRHSHEFPEPCVPDERMAVTVRLNVIGHTLAEGHRWRIAISPTYWPHAWPSPRAVTLTLFGGQLLLPVRPVRAEDAQLTPFDAPEISAPLALDVLRTEARERTVHYDALSGKVTMRRVEDSGRIRFPNGQETDDRVADIYTIVEGDPLSATVRCERRHEYLRGDWHTCVETVSVMTADLTHFHITNQLDAYEGQTRVFTKNWHLAVPRDLV